MPWAGGSFSRTDGTRTGTTVWAQAKAAAIKIIATAHDTHDQDLATGINQTINKDGSNAFTGDADLGSNQLTNVGAGSAATDGATIGGTETLAGKTMTAVKWVKGADIASATTLVLGTDGNFFDITGTTTITGFTVAAGTLFMLQFDGILTLTDGASFDVGGANRITVTGDRITCFAVAADTVQMLAFQGARVSAEKVLIQENTPSAAATSDFTTGIDSTFDVYEFELIDVVPATDDARLTLRIQESAAFKSGATDYKHGRQFTTSTPSIGSGGGAAAEITFSETVGNVATGEGLSGRVRFAKPATGSLIKRFRAYDIGHADSSGTEFAVYGGGAYVANGNAITGVQFLFSTGNITSGTIRLYGIRN